MIVEKEWGMERWIENNRAYCLKQIVCKGNIWSSKGKFHYHKIKDETFLVIEGTLELDVMDGSKLTSYMLTKGEHIRIRPGVRHRFRSPYCYFVEASTHHEESDSYRE